MLFFATLLVSILAYIFIAAPSAHAADASWNGASIEYDGNQYLALPSPAEKDGPTHLPEGSITYASRSASDVTPAKSYLIYFAPKTDVTTATKASYIEYDFVPPSTMTNPSNKKTIVIEPQSASNQTTTSCDARFTFSLGWFICPTINLMSGAMDWLFNVLVGFLTVRPLQSSTDSSLYRAWSMMRSFANIAFVIAFLVLIYSQLTSAGISNYGIKKLLPRLIVAAILVNVSYWLCAIAIDASNIIGQSIQDVFIAMRNNIVGPGGNDWDVMSWESVAQLILSGGAAVAGAGIGTVAILTGSVGGSIYLLIPILLSGVLSVMVALLLMAARQAVITVFVILAPLAFVAYLLPNTEKFFDKWRSTFMTMLILFPLFSVVFGGAQLAGIAIIQNANSINVILLGMAVQVVPLAVTPMLIKFGGGLLNRFAGIINNPNKGFVDRSRKWAQERAGQHKDRVLGNPATGRLNRASQRLNMAKRRREDWQKVNQANAENTLQKDGKYAAIDNARREGERTKSIIQNKYDETWNVKAKLDKTSLEQEITLRASVDKASLAKSRMDSVYEEIKSGNRAHAETVFGSMPHGPQINAEMNEKVALLNEAADTTSHLAVEGMRKQSAEGMQKSRLASALLKNAEQIDGKTLQEYAGGIDEHGANSALATAVSIDRKQYNDHVAEADAIVKHFNMSGLQRQDHAMGRKPVTLKDDAGNTKILNNDSMFTREAVIEAQLSGQGNVAQIEEIILASGGELAEFRTSIAAAIPKHGVPGKAAYWGGVSIDDVGQGRITPDKLNFVVTRTIAQGKIKPQQLATMDKTAMENILNAFQNPTTAGLSDVDAAALPSYLEAMRASAYQALNSDALKGNVANNVKPILETIMGNYTPPPEL